MNFQDDVVAYVELDNTVEARWFRIEPQTVSGTGNFRFELYGLPKGTEHVTQALNYT